MIESAIHDLIIGVGDDAFTGIEQARQIAKRDKTAPFIFAAPTLAGEDRWRAGS
jgi:hypothetical protein